MNDEQLLRYSRQIMLPEIDIEGQEKLLACRVMVLGLGGLGSPIALYLAAAGVGSLTLVDDDQVDLSNLQRQILHQMNSVGIAKTDSAANTLNRLNPNVELNLVPQRFNDGAWQNALNRIDLVLDASDNFATRYALNHACFATGTPLVSGAAIRMEGQVSVFDPRRPDSPCYNCLYPQSSPGESNAEDESLNCAENGVAAPLVGIIGSIQAMEAMKIITGCGETLVGKVLYLDALRMEFRTLKLSRDPACPVCGAG